MKKNNSLISLIKINKKSLEDVLDLLDKIENETYCKPLKIIDNNSMAMHFRHIHDFWNCFLKGIKSKKINYNLRQRNQVFENDKNKMKAAFNLIIDHFDNIKFDDLLIEDDLIDPNKNNISISSNTNRELIFLYEHTVHHIYIIRMVMNNLNIKIKNKLIGYNPSTIKNIKCVS